MISSRFMTRTSAVAALTMAGTFAIAGSASAAPLGFTTYDGNICTGNSSTPGVTTGNGLGECSFDGSPVIARFEFGDDVSSFSIESFYDGVTADDFAFSMVEDLDDGMGGTTFGYSFTYSPDDGDPLITAFAAKGGPSFNLYERHDGEAIMDSVTFLTPLNPGGNRAGLSNVTFFDTELTPTPSPIPLPAAGWMLLAGIGGLAAMRRQRKG